MNKDDVTFINDLKQRLRMLSTLPWVVDAIEDDGPLGIYSHTLGFDEEGPIPTKPLFLAMGTEHQYLIDGDFIAPAPAKMARLLAIIEGLSQLPYEKPECRQYFLWVNRSAEFEDDDGEEWNPPSWLFESTVEGLNMTKLPYEAPATRTMSQELLRVMIKWDGIKRRIRDSFSSLEASLDALIERLNDHQSNL